MNAHAVARHQHQMGTATSPGQASGVKSRLALAVVSRQQDRSGFAGAGFFGCQRGRGVAASVTPNSSSRGTSSSRRRSAAWLILPGFRPVAIHPSLGFVESPDELAEIVILDRAGAYTARPRFIRPLDHLGCNRSDPAKSHVPVLSSAALGTSKPYRTPEPKCWKPLPTRTIAR
jgi:hypothetical protein